jgi:hypothetical protein
MGMSKLFELRGVFVSLLVLMAGAISASAQVSAPFADKAAARGEAIAPESVTSDSKDLVLISTSFSTGSINALVGSGQQTIDDPVILKCPKQPAGRCVYEAVQNVALEGDIYADSGNFYAICTKIDDVLMTNPTCPYIGTLATVQPTSGNFIQTQNRVGRGKHTVQTFLVSVLGARVGYYSIVYRVYKDLK